jgi:putative sigma-54 modulation protein
MQLSVTFRHMEATDALKEYARERMERIKKYFPDPIAVHVVMSTERGYKHRVDVTMQLHNGLTVAGREASESMFSSIDLVIAKIERQVRRYKEKLRTHKARTTLTPVPWSHTVVAESEQAGDEIAEAAPPQISVGAALAAAAAEITAAPVPADASALAADAPLVVKTQKLHANPMSVAEAIMQLNLLDHVFLVFLHDETGRVNVVYRRDDGRYGLIDAEAPEAAVPVAAPAA